MVSEAISEGSSFLPLYRPFCIDNADEEAPVEDKRKRKFWNEDVGKSPYAKVRGQNSCSLCSLSHWELYRQEEQGWASWGRRGTLESATNNRLKPNVNSVPDTCGLQREWWWISIFSDKHFKQEEAERWWKWFNAFRNDSREALNVKKIKKKCPHLSKHSTKDGRMHN